MGGQFFSFYYLPAPPEVRWSESAADVPVWDWTRQNPQGGGLSAYNAFGARWTEEKMAFPLGRALPTPEMAFPHLVRLHPGQQFIPQAPLVHRVLQQLWTALDKSSAYPIAQNTKFRQAVVEAVPQIGLLDPHGTNDTLDSWTKAAVTVGFWLRLLRSITELGAEDVTADFWETLYLDWHVETYSAEDVQGDEYLEDLFKSGIKVLKDRRSRDGGRSSQAANLIAQARSAMPEGRLSVSRARQAIAELLMGQFLMAAARHMRLVPQADSGSKLPTRMLASVGALEWAYYELAELYSDSAVKLCAACGTSFTPQRRDKRFCSKTCQERAKKRQQRTRQQQPELSQPRHNPHGKSEENEG